MHAHVQRTQLEVLNTNRLQSIQKLGETQALYTYICTQIIAYRKSWNFCC